MPDHRDVTPGAPASPIVTSREPVPATERRHWRFWCHGCDEVELVTFTDRDDERLAAVAWVQRHQSHDMGGFSTPFSLTAGCPRCGVSMEAACPGCGLVGPVLWDGTKASRKATDGP